VIKIFSIVALTLFSFQFSPAVAQVSWMKTYGSHDADEGVNVVCDASGNVYLVSSFRNVMTMDTFQLNYVGNQDGVISKIDSTGKILWSNSFGGIYDDKPTALSLSRDGYLIVAGNIYDSCQFGNSTVYGRGYTDAFLAKIDTSNGNVIWVKTAGSAYGYEEANSVCVDSMNNIWIGGSFMNMLIAENDTLLSNGSVDFFILKYDSNGNLLQSKSFGSIGVDNISSISCDALSNIYFCGAFSDTMQIGNYTVASVGLLDVFWAKMNVSGNIIWVKKAGGTNTENVSCIRAFRDGSYYMSGWVQDTAWLDGQLLVGGEGNIFLVSYDITNQLNWLKEGYNLNANELARSITLDKYNNVYLAGQSNFVIQRLEDTGGRMESSEKACPFGDLVFLKYDTTGTMLWMEHTLGTNFNIANGISIDNLGNCFVTGYYTDSIWLGSFLQTALEGSDILLFRFHDQTFNLYNGINNNVLNDLNANVYPNPSDGDFYVNIFSDKSRRSCSVKMYSMQGVKMSEWKIYLEEGMNVLQFNSDASPGMYMLSLEAGNEHARLKLIMH